MPSLKPRKVMSPPSLATAGRTRVSIRSLMVATVSASASLKNSSSSSAASSLPTLPSAKSGAPDLQCSMIPPRTPRLRHIMFHDRAEDRRLEMLPVAVVLGHGDEVGPVKYAGDAGHAKQFFGERRARRGLAVGEFPGAAVEHSTDGDD